MKADQAEQLRRLAARSRPDAAPAASPAGGRVIAVASGKGGVGKTNVVANLGSLLAADGKRVTLLDADFGLANLDILLNLSPARNLGHLLRGEAAAAEILVEVAPNLHLIPGASGLESLADLEPERRAELMAALGALTGQEDFVLVDTAAGIGRNVVELCLASGEVVLVTNTEPTSLTDAYGLAKLLWAKDRELYITLLVNSVRDAEEGAAVSRKLNDVVGRFLQRELAYLGHVVRDPCVPRATQRQTPLVKAYPRCPASRCLGAVAARLVGGDLPQAAAGAGGFWRRLVQGAGGVS